MKFLCLPERVKLMLDDLLIIRRVTRDTALHHCSKGLLSCFLLWKKDFLFFFDLDSTVWCSERNSCEGDDVSFMTADCQETTGRA